MVWIVHYADFEQQQNVFIAEYMDVLKNVCIVVFFIGKPLFDHVMNSLIIYKSWEHSEYLVELVVVLFLDHWHP